MSKHSDDVIGNILQFIPGNIIQNVLCSAEYLVRMYIKTVPLDSKVVIRIPKKYYKELFLNSRWNRDLAYFTAGIDFIRNDGSKDFIEEMGRRNYKLYSFSWGIFTTFNAYTFMLKKKRQLELENNEQLPR